MIEIKRRVLGLCVLCVIWCCVFGADDLGKKAPLKQSKKSNAIEGAVRLTGSDNSFEGKLILDVLINSPNDQRE